MPDPGFKQLTLTNWTEPDPVNAHFARVSPIAGVVPMQASDWARAFLIADLKGHVLAEIRDLFTVAQERCSTDGSSTCSFTSASSSSIGSVKPPR